MESNHLVLGLDLGPNSIGWSLIDQAMCNLIAVGVRVFPEGVARDKKGGEVPKNQARRIARGMRRQCARRSRRKRMLRRALVAAGLLPDVCLRPPGDKDRSAWESEQFAKGDPYALRRRALTEKLELHEIGRVLTHLNQRRGFLSNKKTDRVKKAENSNMLKEIGELAKNLGDSTLGQYLADQHDADPTARLRGRHTQRAMLINEFNAIWEAQSKFHPDLLTPRLKLGQAGEQSYPRPPQSCSADKIVPSFGLYGLIFFQRAMYFPKSVIGRCELEPREKRCPRADRRAQRFRLFQEVNNLRLLDSTTGEERPLSDQERQSLSEYLAAAKERTFDQIRKHLRMHEGVRFNLEAGGRDKLLGMPTDALLAKKDFFGPQWHDRPGEQRNTIVVVLADPRSDEQEVHRLACIQWGLSPESAARLAGIDFDQGYSSYSILAIQKLLPHLEKGLPMMSTDGSPSALSEAGYLRPDQKTVNQRQFLPEPPMLTNPLVRQALHQVRKVVNAVLRELIYRPGQKLRAIHIELAREVKGGAKQREQRTERMREREKQRDNAAERIRESGGHPTRELIDRYLLWEEQDHYCMYTYPPREIGITQLLADSGEIQVDHILPYSRSLDNSFENKVLCFRNENMDKANRTPHEWLAASNPPKYDALLQRAATLPKDSYRKAARLRQPEVSLDDFFARQFVDTTYITTQVTEYVKCLGTDVVCSKGQHTAELRHQWGLDGILRNDDLKIKNREDHRHHAVDAIVIALINRSRLQHLAGSRGVEALPLPWDGFRDQAKAAIDAINVSHRVERGVAGALHEETLYGATVKRENNSKANRPWAKDWVEESGVFVSRKPLEELTAAMVGRIRDATIRKLVIERLKNFGIEPGDKKPIPKLAWQEPLLMPSGVRIKRVRVTKADLTIQPIRNQSVYVKPGSLHHVCIFEVTGPKGKTTRQPVFVSMLEATRRVAEKQRVIQPKHPDLPDAKFIMSLSRGEMVLATLKGQQRLVCFRTAASTQGQLYFVDHTDARPGGAGEFAKKANSLKGRKVIVDPLGRIRWAND